MECHADSGDAKAMCLPINAAEHKILKDKICDTDSKLLHKSSRSHLFRKFLVDLPGLKDAEGSIDLLRMPQNLNMEEKEKFLMKQLEVKEKIINILMDDINRLTHHGEKIEVDLDYFSFKVEDLNEECEKLRRELEEKNHFHLNATPKIDCETQTDTDSYNSEIWNDYYRNYYKYYNYDYDNAPAKCENNDDNIIEIERKLQSASVSDEEPNYLNINDSNSSQTIEKGNNSETLSTEDGQSFAKCSTRALKDGDTYVDKCNSSKSLTSHENFDINESSKEWNPCNITEEVKNVAEDITNKLGYVFIEEYGMYYDYSSGYYYDDKTGLFYDSQTGTYFYFNSETNNYEFYMQVKPDSIDHSSKSLVKKKKINEKEPKEEGELTDSEEELEESQTEPLQQVDEIKTGAPSLRLMVMEGQDAGQLHIVTYLGGFIGREGDVDVLVKCSSVSKRHAEITYKSDGDDDHHYFIKDLGSSNGTFVQGTRISESKQESDWVEIGHGWKVCCGNVALRCHIHAGLLTCNGCEPGLVETKATTQRYAPKNLDKDRRRQNKVIKKKFSLGAPSNQGQLNANYQDRAFKRRQDVGSDNPYEKTETASTETSLRRDNKGYQLLQKMGWNEGEKLGTNERGISEPVCPIAFIGRAGLGSSCQVEPSDVKVKRSNYLKMLPRTRERYDNAMCPVDKEREDESDLEVHTENSAIQSRFKPIKFTPASQSEEPS